MMATTLEVIEGTEKTSDEDGNVELSVDGESEGNKVVVGSITGLSVGGKADSEASEDEDTVVLSDGWTASTVDELSNSEACVEVVVDITVLTGTITGVDGISDDSKVVSVVAGAVSVEVWGEGC